MTLPASPSPWGWDQTDDEIVLRRDKRRKAVEDRLMDLLPAKVTWVWSDGPATGGFQEGEGGAPIAFPGGDIREVQVAAGYLCSSTRAEFFALRPALKELSSGEDRAASQPIVVGTESLAVMALLQSDPCDRRTPVAADIWSLLRPPARSPTEDSQSSCSGSPLTAACPAPSERTLSRGGPAPSLNAIFRSTSRPSSRPSCSPSDPPGSWPDGWFRPMWRDRRPVPVEEADRSIGVDNYQLRVDHWSESEECLRIGRLSSPDV